MCERICLLKNAFVSKSIPAFFHGLEISGKQVGMDVLFQFLIFRELLLIRVIPSRTKLIQFVRLDSEIISGIKLFRNLLKILTLAVNLRGNQI